MADAVSGPEAGRRNAEILAKYLAKTPQLPTHHGKPNVRRVAEQCGFRGTKVIYDNPACRKMWEEALASRGLAGIETQLDGGVGEDRRVDGLRAELSQAREHVTSLQAENRKLRERLRRLSHIERHLLETGSLAR